jgi:hypothetical protein
MLTVRTRSQLWNAAEVSLIAIIYVTMNQFNGVLMDTDSGLYRLSS